MKQAHSDASFEVSDRMTYSGGGRTAFNRRFPEAAMRRDGGEGGQLR
jgi:hypothetical protein